MNEPCKVKWCAALAVLNGKCIAHLQHGEALHPQVKEPAVDKHWPVTLWDDEQPVSDESCP